MEDRPESGPGIEEVIGPDGRYVLYYRWADGADADERGQPDGEAPLTTKPVADPPHPPLDADV